MVNKGILVSGGRTASMRNVDVFSASPHGDNPFTDRDLDTIVRNFNRFCARNSFTDGIHYEPPVLRLPSLPADAGIGHETGQEFLRALLNRTDLPSAGWVTKLWKAPVNGTNHLFANIDGIPEEVAKLIASGELRWCSSEFNPDFNENGKSYGPALRRVSYLGATPPRIKDLQPLPHPVYSFSEKNSKIIICFSEMRVMDRVAMIQTLQQMGCDTSKITDMTPDDVIASWLSSMQAANQKMSEMSNGNGNKPENKPEEKSASFADEEKMIKCSEAALKRLLPGLLAPITNEINGLKSTVSPIAAGLAKSENEAKRNKIVSFCERMRREGKMTPYEIDGQIVDGKIVHPSAVDRMMLLDDVNKLVAFSDGKGGALTQLEMEFKTIEARQPLRKFSETLPSPSQNKVDEQARRKLHELTPTGRAWLKDNPASVN